MLKTMLLHYLHDFLAAVIQPANRSNRAVLSDDDETLVGIIRVLCTVTLSNCKNGVFSDFIRLSQTDFALSHLFQSMTFKTQRIGNSGR